MKKMQFDEIPSVPFWYARYAKRLGSACFGFTKGDDAIRPLGNDEASEVLVDTVDIDSKSLRLVADIAAFAEEHEGYAALFVFRQSGENEVER